MLYLKPESSKRALLDAFTAAIIEIPGSACYRSTEDTFSYVSTFDGHRRYDPPRTVTLTPQLAGLLLYYERIPEPASAIWRRLCPSAGCCNAEHWERVALSHRRASRIERAQTPDDLFPPRMLRPMTPSGYARAGVRNPKSTLSDETVCAVLRLRYSEGLTQSAIAARLGLKLRAVTSICNGNSHRWLAQRIKDDLIAGARQSGLLPPAESEESAQNEESEKSVKGAGSAESVQKERLMCAGTP